MNTPRLSVILLSLNGGVSVKKVIRRLSTLVCADQMEIVLGIGDMPLAIEPPTCFAGFRVVHTAVSEDIGKARAAAIRAAAAPIVVLGEDHSFPTEGWAQALLAEFESGVAGVGPRI
ncbi:MAG: hypothetical protein LAO79_14990, partial [Acidobacteriia bacterium]|nr:hypothetical protein [Terriglobia bacterium]